MLYVEYVVFLRLLVNCVREDNMNSYDDKLNELFEKTFFNVKGRIASPKDTDKFFNVADRLKELWMNFNDVEHQTFKRKTV